MNFGQFFNYVNASCGNNGLIYEPEQIYTIPQQITCNNNYNSYNDGYNDNIEYNDHYYNHRENNNYRENNDISLVNCVKQHSPKNGDSVIHFAKTILSAKLSYNDRKKLNGIAHSNDTAGKYFDPKYNIYQGQKDMTYEAELVCLQMIKKYDLNIDNIRKGFI